MNRPKRALIVGGGGIGCYLAPFLCRIMDVVIMDGDSYEPENHSRQFPALTSKGNKGQVLAEILGQTTIHKVEFIGEYLKGNEVLNKPEIQGIDIIFGAVDNNASRRIIMDLADTLDIPAIMAGNEDEHGEAHLFLGGVYDPRDYFPFEATEPTPWACNSDQAMEETGGQTAIANMIAAGCAVHLLNSWIKVEDPVNTVAYSRNDALMGVVRRVRDFAQNADH